jgi:hypothetical protein
MQNELSHWLFWMYLIISETAYIRKGGVETVLGGWGHWGGGRKELSISCLSLTTQLSASWMLFYTVYIQSFPIGVILMVERQCSNVKQRWGAIIFRCKLRNCRNNLLLGILSFQVWESEGQFLLKTDDRCKSESYEVIDCFLKQREKAHRVTR